MDRHLTHQSSVAKSDLDLGSSHNNVLPDDVQQNVRQQLSDAEHRLESLDSTINDLKAEHSDVARSIQSFQIEIAPHRKLPSDILLEIFFHCTPSFITAYPHISGLDAELHNLIRVCSEWRTLALHTPTLWRNITVHYETEADIKRNATLLRNIVLRCGDLSISLHIRVEDNADLSIEAIQNRISDLVIEVAGRLRDFTWIGDQDLLEKFLMMPAGSVEYLENVCLKFYAGENHQPLGNNWPFCVFEDAHKLHSFTLEAVYEPFTHVISPFSLHIPCDQMTYLEFTNYHMECTEWLLLLCQCPKLSEFHGTIFGSLFDIEHPLPSPVPALPNLHRLQIGCHPEDFEKLFPRLDLPNLAFFKLHTARRIAKSDWEKMLLPFLIRSNRLTHLSIDSAVPGEILHTYFLKLPLLVSFSVRKGEPLLETTLEAIARGELAPMLETLECSVVVFEPFVRMLEQRYTSLEDEAMHGFSRIQNVVGFRGRSWVSTVAENWNTVESVERLRVQGLCIEFRDIHGRRI
jgi:F-box-like